MLDTEIFCPTDIAWEDLSNRHHHICRIALVRDTESGGFTALARRLPGVISEGASIQEAIQNLVEAFHAAVESYLACNEKIPWHNVQIDEPVEAEFQLSVDIDA